MWSTSNMRDNTKKENGSTSYACKLSDVQKRSSQKISMYFVAIIQICTLTHVNKFFAKNLTLWPRNRCSEYR